MNKAEFFKHCKDHAAESGVKLRIDVRRESRGLDNVLYLDGCWYWPGTTNCAYGYVELYRPLAGRQGRADAPYKVANERLAVAKIKFQRWLDEFNAAKQQSSLTEGE
jgi:hypothetical protein